MYKLIYAVLLCGLSAVATVAQTESLLIGPGDMIHIDIFDTPEMAQDVRVTDAGTVQLEFIGELKIIGETPAGAAKIVAKALIDKRIMLDPQVTVRIAEYATLDVSVIGQVQSPGTFPIATAQPILKILSEAGGLTNIADRNIIISRHGDSSQKLQYYLSNDAEQALTNGVMVYPGDIVIVPRAPVVYIMGDVAKPGGYSINTNDSKLTVLEALAMAGSANKTSSRAHIRLIRKTGQGQEEVSVELAAIEKGKKPDIPLKPDDILYIPFSWMKNAAMSAGSIAASTSSAAIYAIP
jgi:polysaccharide biosynthesis/export protein